MVRSMRPASLPEMPATFQEGGVCFQQSAASTPTPMGGCGSGQQEAAVRTVMDENRRLWTELEGFKYDAECYLRSWRVSIMILGRAQEGSEQQGPSLELFGDVQMLIFLVREFG